MSQHAKDNVQLLRRHTKSDARMSHLQARDLTRQLRAEIQWWRNAFTENPLPIAILEGPDLSFSQANDAYLKLVARNRTHLLHKPIGLVFPELVQQGLTQRLYRVYQSGKSFRDSAFRWNGLGSRGPDPRTFEFTCFPKHGRAGKVVGVVCQFVNVTRGAMRQAELERQIYQSTLELQNLEQRLQLLNRYVMRVREEERRRLGIELHDRSGQLLAALKWKLSILQRNMAGRGADLSSTASDALDLSSELSQELRTVSLFLCPPSLRNVGLEPAIRSYVDALQERSGLAVDLQIDPALGELPQALETVVFGVVQESLSNIYRHARTKKASIRITSTGKALKVEISDQGIGIPGFNSLAEPGLKIGVGIRGMQERVLQARGEIDIKSAANGTTVTVVLPIRGSVLRPTSTLVRTIDDRDRLLGNCHFGCEAA